MGLKSIILTALIFSLSVNLASAAHYIVGVVNNAKDGQSANSHTVMLWNASKGIQENLTDVIGPSGNSGVDNVYMIDCEMLSNPCKIGDILKVKVINNGDNYISYNASVTVTGAGYDVAENLTLNSPPNITSIFVEDFLLLPSNEIDLLAANTASVTCDVKIEDDDGKNSLTSINVEFFDSSNSGFNQSDDNNLHYSNNSCYTNASYGNENQTQVICTFNVWYYANAGQWKCLAVATDNLSIPGNSSYSTNINELLSIGVDSNLTYSLVGFRNVSNQGVINITNYGNVKINLSLAGFARTEGDGLAMNCTQGEIPVYFEKFNLTSSNVSAINLTQFESIYVNLTSNKRARKFDLNYRQNDTFNEVMNTTYWRIYVPQQRIGGMCSGNILIGAVKGGES
jgi:hypothetical protein